MNMFVVNNKEYCEELLKQGVCPIECSFGETSVVDEKKLDHHGKYSYLEPVSVRACRDFWGIYRDRLTPYNGFMCAENADADATFAAAAMLGLFPRDEKNLALAETIGIFDLDPIGKNRFDYPGGNILALWQMLSGDTRTDEGFETGVFLWKSLLALRENDLFALSEPLKKREEERISLAKQELREKNIIFEKLPVAGLVDTEVFGFDVWYSRKENSEDPEKADSWKHPFVVALVKATGKITFGCPNKAVAEELFGPGGLKNLYKELGNGWGGRESVGGSPRGMTCSVGDLMGVVQTAFTWRLSDF